MSEDARMNAREIPSVGEVGALVLGAMGFERLSTDQLDVSRYDALLDHALAEGVTSFDTAPLYGFHGSERYLGSYAKRRGVALNVFTKVGLRWDDTHGDVLFAATVDGQLRRVRKDARPESITLGIEGSCERLGVSKLPLVLVHHRDKRVPIDETMGALVDAWKRGRVGAVGVSNHNAADVEIAARAVHKASEGKLALSCTQDLYNLLNRDAEKDLLRVNHLRGLGFLAFSPLAQGLLSGAMGPARVLNKDDWRGGMPAFSRSSRTLIQSVIERDVEPLARRHGVHISAVCIAWVIAQPGVSAAIVGARDRSQLREWLAAATLQLNERELARIGDAFASIEHVTRPNPLGGLLERVRGKFSFGR